MPWALKALTPTKFLQRSPEFLLAHIYLLSTVSQDGFCLMAILVLIRAAADVAFAEHGL